MAKNAKKIEVRCKGAGTLSITQLIPLQGKLKTLMEANYKRLRAEIIRDGFIEPISIWEDKETGKTFVLNGHQRLEVLNRMKAEGWSIPQIPVNYVEASDIQDAKRKVLAMASQYGTVSTVGMKDFLADMSLDVEDFKEHFSFPELDISAVLSGVSAHAMIGDSEENSFLILNPVTQEPPKMPAPDAKTDADKEWKGMPEFKQEDKGPFRSIIIHFFDQEGVDDFAKLIKQNITDKTRMTWYPEMVIEKAADKRYGNFES